MDELTPERLTHNSYTVGWICALDVELAASVAILDYELPKLSQVQGDTNTYVLGRIGQHNIILTCLPAGTTGTNAAANTATNMLRSFPNIHFCLMVGIGGGAPSVPSDDPREDIRLGDVVVSCPSANSGGVLQYDFGKTMSEGKFVQTGVLNKTSIVLSNSVSAMRARHRIEGPRIPKYIDRMLESNTQMQEDFSHPGLAHDQLFRAEYEHPSGESDCHCCDIEALVVRKSRENTDPVVHYGLIGSANQVMKHGATRDKLRDEKNVICFEMEAAGLMDVFPCLVIRGICDYADLHKNKRWQPYAAVTAAAYAKEVLLFTPTSEVPVKSFFNGEAIYNMLRTTVYESSWIQLRKLLPVGGYAHHQFRDTLENCDHPDFHWAFRNIDFEQWNLNEGRRVLCLTGHPSEDILNQLSSYIVGREKAAGYSVLPLLCSNMMTATTVATFLHIFLLELVSCSPDAQKTPIIRSFLSKLLENPRERDLEDWKEEKFNTKIFSKYMKTILERATTKDILDSLKTAFDFERQRRLLVVISNLEAIESVDRPDSCVLPLIKHLQQRKPHIRMLLTSSERPKTATLFQNFLHIEYNKERQECLQSLHFDNTRYEKISEAYEGSFQWIWTHNEYESWFASDTSKLLYIQGKPGSGKSTLIKYFNRNLISKDPDAQQTIIARFFYSFRDGELQRSHYNMLLSILYEILHQDESFFYHQCQTEFRAHRHSGTHRKWNYDSLKRTLKSLQDYWTSKRFYLIIDAIDESDESDRREILGLLLDLCSKMKHSVVKIFMTSRPVAQLEARRGQFHNFIKLDDMTQADIRQYAQSRLRGLSSTDNLLTQATEYMLKNAQGVFLWVKLISEQLIDAHERGCSEGEVFELLERLPTALEDFYSHMLEEMKQNNSSHSYAARMFRIILFAKRPLTVDELLHALGISNSVDSDSNFIPCDTLFKKSIPSSEMVILSNGGNFLEIKKQNGNRIVQVMHQTVREFFLNPNGPAAKSPIWVSDTHAHMNIAVTCIRYLSVCATNTSLVGKLPKTNSWDTAHYQDYCQYLDKRPLASYALSYIKSHVDSCEQDKNVKNATSQLIECLTDSNAGASLLERWAGYGLHQGSLSTSNIQDAVAMSFRSELLRYSSTYGLIIAAEIVLLAETAMDNQDEDGQTPLSLAAGSGHEAVVNLLLDKGASIDMEDNTGRTSLSWAAGSGHEAVVKLLLDKDASIDMKDSTGRASLSWAAGSGHEAVVDLLLDKGASIDKKDDTGRTSLSWAASSRHEAVVSLLLDKDASIDMEDNTGRTSLSWAAGSGHEVVLNLMLDKGASINKNDKNGLTPLSWAVMNGHRNIVIWLSERGASTGATDNYNRSLLSLAAEHNHPDIVKFLFDTGANIKAPINDEIYTKPLSYAAKHGYLAILKFLIEKGANIEKTSGFGRTPLLWAAEYGHLAIVEFLFEIGAKIEKADDSGKSPLSWAAKQGHLGLVEFLVESGADINIHQDICKTPLSWAAEHGHSAIVEFLVEKGAVIGIPDWFGLTPLSWAAKQGHLGIVKFLVEKGAIIESRDSHDKTPLALAAEYGHLAIVRFFIKVRHL